MTNDTAQFKIGDPVIIKRCLGENGRYFYGRDLKDVPLGSKGVVIEHYGDEHYHVRINKRNLCFNPGEFELNREILEKRQREVDSLLENILLVDEPLAGSEKTDGRRSFNPKFNPREEFAVWIREQFPGLGLGRRAEDGPDYKAMIERREEIIGAARLAYEHAMKTTKGCTRDEFENYFKNLEGDQGYFVGYLNRLVRLIESVASNLEKQR